MCDVADLVESLRQLRSQLAFSPQNDSPGNTRNRMEKSYDASHDYKNNAPRVDVALPMGSSHIIGSAGVATVSDATSQSHNKPFEQNSASWVHDMEDHFETGENLIAGALSGLVAETLMHPFDTVSHRAKVHPSSAYGHFAGAFRLIYKQEGLRGYFAGVSATVAQSPPANAAYFFAYEWLKRCGMTLCNGNTAFEPLVFFIAGGLSELASSLCFVPFDVVKSRLQLGENPARATGGMVSATTNYRSLVSAFAGIYRERSWRGLTAGWGAGLMLDMTFSGTQFLLYEQCKRAMKRYKRRQQINHHSQHVAVDLNTRETLLCGCISGGFAAALTNPLDVIASRLQCQDASAKYGTNFVSVFRATVAEGSIALWRGTLPRVAQVAPLSALSFGVYEFMRRYLKDTALFRTGTSDSM